MKKIIVSLAVFAALYGIFNFSVHYLTDGFSLKKISSDLCYHPEWEVLNPKMEEIAPLLQQKFYYLGRGSQCFAFESADKQIVLKFFRMDRFKVPLLAKWIKEPSFLANLLNEKKQSKEKKLQALMTSCKIGFDELHEETGLIFLHLNRTSHLYPNKEIEIYDGLDRPYRINLDEFAFIIQIRGEQIFPYLSNLLAAGKENEAKEALDNLASLIASRLSKGIADHDAVIHKNSGFKGKKALFIDVGGFSKLKQQSTSRELWDSTHEIRVWLQEKNPTLSRHFTLALFKKMIG